MFGRRRRLRAGAVGRDLAESEQNERLAELEEQAAFVQPVPVADVPPAVAAGDSAGSRSDLLDQIATLHQRGAMTDEEFTASIGRLLGGEPLDGENAG
jgi:hypothetical protein